MGYFSVIRLNSSDPTKALILYYFQIISYLITNNRSNGVNAFVDQQKQQAFFTLL